MLIQEHVSIKALNSFHMDVKARYYVEVDSLDALQELYTDPVWRDQKKLILGGGSNLLLRSDFDGMVIHIANKGIQQLPHTTEENEILVEVAAGEIWHEFVMHCVEQNWHGLENLSLIPGRVGAAPMQNIGAYGVEMKDCFHSLRAWNCTLLQMEEFNKDACAFGYRESVFKRALKDKYIIWSVRFALKKQASLNISYGAIADTLGEMHITNPGIRDVSEAVIRIRKAKLPDPAEIGNSGSFFKNPEISLTQFEKIKSAYPQIPFFPSAHPGLIKLPAAWLIEQCGWKGYRRGDAGCHAKQPLVLVNYGNASGQEIWTLAQQIITSVHEKFEIELEPEVNLI